MPAANKKINPENWVDRHGDYLYSYALVRVRQPDVAEDLVQETFAGAWRAVKDYKGNSAERTWLVGILKHKIVDSFRKRYRELQVEDIEQQHPSNLELFDESGNWLNGPGSWQSIPWQQYDATEFAAVLKTCMDELPDRLAQAFVLREMEDMECAEICKVLGISSTNCWVILYRARMGLKKCLSKSWFDKT